MALSFADFVEETTQTSGKGKYELDGAKTGRQSFVSGVGNGATVQYSVSNGVDWEVTEGKLTSGNPDTLTRGTIIDSSNNGNKVDWNEGTKDIFLVISADWVGPKSGDSSTHVTGKAGNNNEIVVWDSNGNVNSYSKFQYDGKTLSVKADSSQGSNNLEEWKDNSNNVLQAVEANGAQKMPITTITSDTTLDDSHWSVLADTSSNNITVTLPKASNATGRVYNIKKIDSSNTLTIDGDGTETIDGDETKEITTNNDVIVVQSNGTNWFIVS